MTEKQAHTTVSVVLLLTKLIKQAVYERWNGTLLCAYGRMFSLSHGLLSAPIEI